jgi:8-oxo-dGTP pyrophosphatase MutT (NUDIX family)
VGARLAWGTIRAARVADMAARVADIEAGRIIPAQPRDAATVIVLRPAADAAATSATAPVLATPAGDGVEVLMLRRAAAMAFAPGAYVYPGGSVDLGDADLRVGWHGPSAADIGERLGASPELARALVCAAVRETFEEAGILLAGTPDGSLAVPDGPAWDRDRAALMSGSETLAEVLARRGLVVRADLLTPWARWITPEAEPKRFDARFFAAALPPGQQATGHVTETEQTAWLRPEAAIEAARGGSVTLMPPTATTLNELAARGGLPLPQILGQRRVITPVQPRFEVDQGQAWLVIPDEADYPL